MRSEQNTHEDNYLKYINNATDSKLDQRIIPIRKKRYRLEHQERIYKKRKRRSNRLSY